MKKILLTAALLAGLSTTVSVYAQGTILLDNGPGGNIYVGAGSTAGDLLGVDLGGATLFGGAVGAGAPTTLASVSGAGMAGTTVDFGKIAVPGTYSVTGVALGGTAELRLQIWMGNFNSYAAAVAGLAAVADSGLFSNPTGGDGAPPSLPKQLSGLPDMHLVAGVPEPSTLALAGLGAAALLAYRRRNR